MDTKECLNIDDGHVYPYTYSQIKKLKEEIENLKAEIARLNSII
jgi:hypothetical protein